MPDDVAEKKKRKTSEVWKYFDPINGKDDFANCTFCMQPFSYKTTTSNLKKHLRSKHSQIKIDGDKTGDDVEDVSSLQFVCKRLQNIKNKDTSPAKSPRRRDTPTIEAHRSTQEPLKTTEISFVEDEYDLFARYMASQLRQLPLSNAIRLQEQIQTLVCKERLGCITQEAISTVNGFHEQFTQYTVECTTSPNVVQATPVTLHEAAPNS